MNTIVNSIIKNTIALRNANVSSLKVASSNSNTTGTVDNGISALNSGTMATGIAVGVLTLVLIVFFIAVIIHYRMIRKLPEPVYETNDEKVPKPPPRNSLSRPNTAHVNNLYLAPTKNYNPKLERINEDISSISNSMDAVGVNPKSMNPFHHATYLPTTQYSRRSSADELDNANMGPTMLVNTNSDLNNNMNNSINLNEAAKSEKGVILSVKRIDNYNDAIGRAYSYSNRHHEQEDVIDEDDDDDDVKISKASL